jgi:hypothetical protein
MKMPSLRTVALSAAGLLAAVVTLHSARVAAQSDDLSRAGTTLDTVQTLLGWPAPEADAATDVRIMTRSALALVPLPVIRLTADQNGQVVAAVTQWSTPPPADQPAVRAFSFVHPPVRCDADRSVCTGSVQEMRGPEVKALWFALLIARSCNDGRGTRTILTDAEDLFVRGRVGGVPLLFACRGPNPKGASPGDRQAAAVLRISHHLLGR